MEADGLVRSAQTHMTSKGTELPSRSCAVTFAERFLTDILSCRGPTHIAGSGKWEHVISPRSKTRWLACSVSPRPRAARQPDPRFGLSARCTMPTQRRPGGHGFIVSRIPQELEFSPGCSTLEQSSLVPGRNGTVTAARPMAPPPSRSVGARRIGTFASERILVSVSI